MNVIPAIDLMDGRCVRLLRGNFDAQTEYSDDPVSLARDYEAMGFEQLHIVDLDGARSGRQQNAPVIREIVGTIGLSTQLGGGIRDESELEAWLDAGIDRVVIGSLAVVQAARVRDWLASYGGSKIILALDVTFDKNPVPRIATHGWSRASETTLWQCLDDYAGAGLKHVLCTDTGRDGALTGPNLHLYTQLIERYPEILVQASGGVRNVDDLRALEKIGVPAAITGRALLDGRITAGELRSFLPAA